MAEKSNLAKLVSLASYAHMVYYIVMGIMYALGIVDSYLIHPYTVLFVVCGAGALELIACGFTMIVQKFTGRGKGSIIPATTALAINELQFFKSYFAVSLYISIFTIGLFGAWEAKYGSSIIVPSYDSNPRQFLSYKNLLLFGLFQSILVIVLGVTMGVYMRTQRIVAKILQPPKSNRK